MNATTRLTSTNYYFEVAATSEESPPLHGALDRFAQFFIEPLFSPSALDREVRVIDSEHNKNLQSDEWRLQHLDRFLSNPKHLYCHFATGSLQTLETSPKRNGLDIRSELMQFYEKYYSANRMKLVVLGQEHFDEIERWVEDLFIGVENKKLPQNRWEDELSLRGKDFLTQCFVELVMALRSLHFQFPFSDEEELIEMLPGHYISHLIGHEGPGSILSDLRSKGWAINLDAWAFQISPGSPRIFNCQIELIEDGLKYYQDIVTIFFRYISLLKKTSPQKWIFDKLKFITEINFKFGGMTSVDNFTREIILVIQKPLPWQ